MPTAETTITGIPSTITRKQYLDLITNLGLDPRGVVSLELQPDGIYAEAYVTDEDGGYVVNGSEIATHRIFIRVADTP